MEGEAAAADYQFPTSPSSLSSSDLDTESTGSFFHDRSTSLGTLMGVSFPDLAARRRDLPRPPGPSAAPAPAPREALRRRSSPRGRRWWHLCWQDDISRRTSLGDFLRVERRVGPPDAYYGAPMTAEHEAIGGAPLFSDGMVLPPSLAGAQPPHRPARRPVLLTGICSGGEG